MYPTSYNPIDAFDVQPDSVKLKEFPSDVVAYFNGDYNLAAVLTGIKEPSTNINTHQFDQTYFNNGNAIPGFIRVRYNQNEAGELCYHKSNFRNFQYGTIRFKAKKASCKNDYAYIDATGFKGLERGSYDIIIRSHTNSLDTTNTIHFTLESDLNSTKLNKLAEIIEASIRYQGTAYDYFKCEAFRSSPELSYSDTLRFSSRYIVTDNTAIIDDLTIINATTVASLFVAKEDNFFKQYFTNINESYFAAPNNDTVVFGLEGKENKKNQLLFVHRTDGYLYVEATDEDEEYTLNTKLCPWTFRSEEFADFEYNFDANLANFIVNGKIVKSFEPIGIGKDDTDVNNIIRSKNPDVYVTMVGTYNGTNGDSYDYQQFAVFNKKQSTASYKLEEGGYFDNYGIGGYVEYRFGDIIAYDDKKLTISGTTGSEGMKFEMYDGSNLVISSPSMSEFMELVNKYDIGSDGVSFEAADLIFRVTFLDKDSTITKFEFSSGTPIINPDDPYNFEDVFGWIRRELGAPQVPVELTDDQLLDAIAEATSEYNKWRNYDENLQIEATDGSSEKETDLRKGYSEKEGVYYILPCNISEKDVIKIYFHPRYSSAWFNSGNDFVNNYMAQTFFAQTGQLAQSAADYFIYRTSLHDTANILGTHISWRFYNHHLYITPNNSELLGQFKVGIVYKQPLTIDEIKNEYLIKRYALGRAMVILGNIRGTFGGQVQTGDITLTLNAESLLQRGQALIDSSIEQMKKQAYPLTWVFS